MSKKQRATEGQKQNIKELYENGMDIKDIAFRVDRSLPTIYKYTSHLSKSIKPKYMNLEPQDTGESLFFRIIVVVLFIGIGVILTYQVKRIADVLINICLQINP